MLEMRISYASKVSKTLIKNLGRNQLTKEDLKKVAIEVTNASNKGIIFGTIDTNPEEFKALLYYYNEDLIYYLLCNRNDKINGNATWFFIAHEIGHLILHADLVELGLVNQSPEVEEQANFFARLCFWPMERITHALLKGWPINKILNYDRSIRIIARGEPISSAE